MKQNLSRSSPSPDPLEAGDANCDGVVIIGDVVSLVNYMFKLGHHQTVHKSNIHLP